MRAELKSLATDTAIYGLSTVIGRFLSFLLVPLYTNFLPLADVGLMTYLFALIPFINIIYSFGMEASFFRFYKKDDFIENQRVFSHSFFTIALISGGLSAIIFFLSPTLAPFVTNHKDAVVIIGLASLIPFLDSLLIVPYAALRMKRQVRKFALFRLLQVVVGVVMNIVFIVIFNFGLAGIFWATIIASIFGIFIFLPEIIKYLRIEFDFPLFRQMLKFGLPTIPANFSAIVLQVADKPILKALTNYETVGIYSVNYKLGIPMMFLVTMFEYAWKPFYLSHFEDRDAKPLFSRVLTYFTLLSSIIFLVLTTFLPEIVNLPFIGGRFINPLYWQGLGIVPIILAGYYFNGVFTNFAAGLYIHKKTGFLPIAVGIGAAINIVMNFTLIPVIGYKAAAWATLAAYFINALVIYFYAVKIYPLPYEWKRVFTIILTTILLFFATDLIVGKLEGISVIIAKAGIIALYFLLLRLLKFFTPSEISGMRRLFGRK